MQSGPTDPVEKGAEEGAAFRASARANRRGPVLVTIAAVAALGVAVLAKQVTPPAPTPTAVPQPSPAAVVSSVAPSVAPSPEPTSVPPPLDPTATPHATAETRPVSAGRARLEAVGTAVDITLTLPAGWEQKGPAMYVKPSTQTGTGLGSSPPDPGLSISAWRVADVYLYPCRWATGIYVDQPPDRPTAVTLADALSHFWGQDPDQAPSYTNSTIAPLATKPRPATLAGRDATYLEVLIRSDLDFSQCDGGQVVLWKMADGGVRMALGPSEHHQLWVVDVDRGPIVIDASSALTPSAKDQAELQSVIDSIAFEP